MNAHVKAYCHYYRVIMVEEVSPATVVEQVLAAIERPFQTSHLIWKALGRASNLPWEVFMDHSRGNFRQEVEDFLEKMVTNEDLNLEDYL